MSQPSTVDLSPKDEAIVGPQVWNLDCVVWMVIDTPANSDVGVRPILLPPIFKCVCIVKLTLNLKLNPHFSQVIRMFIRRSVITELVFNLNHYYWPFVFVEKGANYCCQCSEILLDLHLVKLVRWSYLNSFNSEHTCRQSSEIPFRANVGARAKKYIHSIFFGQG
jgi:hypothetical protein